MKKVGQLLRKLSVNNEPFVSYAAETKTLDILWKLAHASR